MRLWTWSELQTKVERDLAIQEEQFVEPDELLGYANEAIDEAEAEVLGLYEDYFLTRASITLVVGQEAYALPSDIYAQKIRRVIYNNGSDLYEVARLRDWKKFEIYADENLYKTSDRYQYMITSETAGSQSNLILAPKSRESGTFLTVWYLRNANRLVTSTDLLDIPESANFVMQFMKVRCYEKEGHPSVGLAIEALEHQRDLLRATLSTMVPDANNMIEMNLEYYEDQW